MSRTTLVTLSAAVVVALGGCAEQKCCRETAQTTVNDGRQYTKYAIPTGHKETSVLMLEKNLPEKIIAGQEFCYEVTVTNIDHTTAKAVAVRDDCASQLTIVHAEPSPLSSTPPFIWNLGDINPCESRTIKVTGKVRGGDAFTSCAMATYNTPVCLTAPVEQPALRATIVAPADATPCDTIPIRMTVANTGNGTARDVRLFCALPEGWTTPEGKQTAELMVDILDPDQTREFTINARASKPGEFTSKVTATGSPALRAEAVAAATTVRQAVLAMKAQGPEHVYVGRPATIRFTATNTGNGPATAAIVEAPLPPGSNFVSATEGGVLRNNIIAWNLDTLPAKASKVLSMTVEPAVLGALDSGATFKAACASPARDGVSVSVFGISGLLLDVADLTDPVEIGGEVIYEITITNQGTAEATNIKINAALEPSEQFVSASGARATLTGAAIAFDPIPTIAPKAKAVLRVVAKCLSEADARFRVSMTADQLSRPVEESESTHIVNFK